MSRFFARFLAVFVVAAVAAGCAGAPPVKRFPTITFEHAQPLRLAVGRIEVVDRYDSPVASPNVEHLMPQSPEAVLKQWVSDRLVADGGTDVARIHIVDGAVVETDLTTNETLKAKFTDEQAQRYDAGVEAVIEIRSDAGRFRGKATARAERSVTIPENASINEREQTWFDLVDRLMGDFDRTMEQNVRRHLAEWVR